MRHIDVQCICNESLSLCVPVHLYLEIHHCSPKDVLNGPLHLSVGEKYIRPVTIYFSIEWYDKIIGWKKASFEQKQCPFIEIL